MQTVSHLDNPMEVVAATRDAVTRWAGLACNDRPQRMKRAEPCLRALERSLRMLETYERHLLPLQFSAKSLDRQRHAAALQLVGATVERVLWAAHSLCRIRS